MKHNKFYAVFLLCIGISLLLCGCWDNREMEDRSYVITLGLDKGKDENTYNVTIGPAQLSALSEGGSKPEENAAIQVEGATLGEALHKADRFSSKQVYLGQLKTVVFGKELLAEKDLFLSILDELERNREISQKIIFLATEKKAADCVNTILKEDDGTGLFIWDFYKSTAQDVAETQAMDMETFLRNLRESQGQAMLPRIAIEEKKLKLGGGIALADYGFCGVLNDKEQRGAFLLKGEGTGAIINGEWENTTIPLWLYKNQSKITFSEENNRLICHVLLETEGSIEGSDFLGKALFDSETIKKLENLFEKIIKAEILNTIKLTQETWQQDIFDFGTELYRQNPTLFYKYAADKKEFLKNMEMDVEIQVTIRTIGVIQ